MFIERLTLTNFRCFGPLGATLELRPDLTVFVGANGTGKTAVMQGLQRLFGITNDQRRIRHDDFHVPSTETSPPQTRTLALEALLSFPELETAETDPSSVPQFFQQMAADANGKLKCRLRLQATLTYDGSIDGIIDVDYWAVRTLGEFSESDCTDIKALDRNRVQLLYVPASRDGLSAVFSLLRGRLWRAVNWSSEVQDALETSGSALNDAFASEKAVTTLSRAIDERWRQVYSAETDAAPLVRPVDLRFSEFVRKLEVVFYPDEAGRERSLEELSDGQRSLFHLAMTAATLDVENQIAVQKDADGFVSDGVPLPALTLLAIEEPENTLAPFYLSRIVRQVADLAQGARAQALISSHSPSILSRVDPTCVRHFRLNSDDRTARIREIRLPAGDEALSKFLREAVRAYSELYFARFVILGEGASEEAVLPLLARAMGFDVDPSFVAVVPLGGRHVNHLWRLLNDLEIPHATLLDLDWGREGGGWGRIKTTCEQLIAVGVAPARIWQTPNPSGPAADLAAFDLRPPEDLVALTTWVAALRAFSVFFSVPLDLDYSLLRTLPDAYHHLDDGLRGPSKVGDPRSAVLGENGRGDFYPASEDDALRWYRYLFIGRGKPVTHVRVLSGQSEATLAARIPEPLQALLKAVMSGLALPT